MGAKRLRYVEGDQEAAVTAGVQRLAAWAVEHERQLPKALPGLRNVVADVCRRRSSVSVEVIFYHLLFNDALRVCCADEDVKWVMRGDRLEKPLTEFFGLVLDGNSVAVSQQPPHFSEDFVRALRRCVLWLRQHLEGSQKVVGLLSTLSQLCHSTVEVLPQSVVDAMSRGRLIRISPSGRIRYDLDAMRAMLLHTHYLPMTTTS